MSVNYYKGILMKKLLLLVTLIFITSNTFAQFQKDVIVTSPDGIWTDSRAYTSLNAAVTAVGLVPRKIVIASPQIVSTLTVPSNVTLQFERNGSITNTGQLTLQTKNILAEDRQIFTGAGDVDFAIGSVVRSAWFGNFITAINITSDDSVTLAISKQESISSNIALGNNVYLKWESPESRLTMNIGFTFSNIGNVEAGDYQIFAGAGDFDFKNGIELNIRWFEHLRAAITWVETERVTIYISGDNVVDYTDTVQSNIILDFIRRNGRLSISAGIILTITGPMQAFETQQIFDGLGTIDFSFTAPFFGAGRYNGRVTPEMWGCIPDHTMDCAPAIMKAVNSGAANIFLPGGSYGFRTPVTMTKSNFIFEGNSRVYTDLVPLQADISSGAAPNAMFVCAHNSINATFKNLRFSSYGAVFNGWAFSAIDGAAGGQEAMFSTIFDSIWVSMGYNSPGFFTGGLADSWITNSEFELTQTSWNLNGAGVSDNGFFNNNCHSNIGPFIVSTASNVMHVVGLRINNQLQLVAIQLTNSTNWTFDDIYLSYNAPAGIDGGFINLTGSSGIIISDFKAESFGGDMSGILVDNSQVKITNGYIIGSRTTAAQIGAIKFVNTVDVDIDNITISDGVGQQITFWNAVAGDVRIRGLNANKATASTIAMAGVGVPSVNIYVSNSWLLNGEYGGGTSNTLNQIDLATTGNIYFKSNIIGTNDAGSNPVALFRFSGTGLVVMDDNTIIGTEALINPGSTQEVRWDSSSYLPVVVSLTNLSSSTSAVCMYSRSGNMVTVSGRIIIDPVAAVSTTLSISLPIASNLAFQTDLSGVGHAGSDAEGAGIWGDEINDVAVMNFIAGNVNSHYMIFTFTYRII